MGLTIKTADAFGKLPASSGTVTRGALKVITTAAAITEAFKLIDKVVNVPIEGFTFKEGDTFKIEGLGVADLDLSKIITGPGSKNRKDRLAAAGVTDLKKVPTHYASLLLTRNGETVKQGITMDRLLNSDIPSTNTGYEHNPDVMERLDVLRGDKTLVQFSGLIPSERWALIADGTFSVEASIRERKTVNMDGEESTIRPYIYAYKAV